MAQNGISRCFSAIVTGAAAGLLLAGCINFSALDDLKEASPPTGSPFDQALFQDYAFLAHSFGDVGQASYTTFDQEGSISLAETNSDIAGLANAYASKALQLSRGEAVDPNRARTSLRTSCATGWCARLPRDATRSRATPPVPRPITIAGY